MPSRMNQNRKRAEKRRENPSRKELELREATKLGELLGYEYEYKEKFFDVAIKYNGKPVFIELIPRRPGRGVPHKDKEATLRRIKVCKRNNIQLILVEPDTVTNMKGQVIMALMTGESGVIRKTKRERKAK